MPLPDLRTAASLLEKGDYTAARATLELLVRHDRAYAAAHVLLAKIAENESRYTDALEHWDRAYFINPMSTEICVSYENAVLRMLVPGNGAFPVRQMHTVPPLEVIEQESPEAPHTLLPTEHPAAENPAQESVAAENPAQESVAAENSAQESVGSENVDHEPLSDELSGVDDLDRLIDELDSARIIPNPNIDAISDAELVDDIDDVVSETLARIYASQNYFVEAGEVYDKLAVQYPNRKDEFMEKASDMHTRALARN